MFSQKLHEIERPWTLSGLRRVSLAFPLDPAMFEWGEYHG